MSAGPGSGHDAFAYDDAAYVLGALAPQERATFEQHLQTCADCRARVAEIEEVPTYLDEFLAAELIAGRDGAAESLSGADDELSGGDLGLVATQRPPDTLLPGLLRRAATERRRRRGLVAGLATLAAACLVALAILAWPTTTSSGRPAPRALSPVIASPVRADATLVGKAWGTEIDLHCRYSAGVEAGTPYLLVVRDRHGRPEKLGTWTLPPGKEISFSAGTALRPAQIGRVEVALTNGTAILRLVN